MDEEELKQIPETTGSHRKMYEGNKCSGKLLVKIKQQMEFYFSDANLSKDRFLGNLVKGDEGGYVDLEIFKKFNKIRNLCDKVEVIKKAISTSEVIEMSEDGRRVCRKIPFTFKVDDNLDNRTLYVEKLPPHANYSFVKNIFNRFGSVAYVSIPRYRVSNKIKGFAFVEFNSEDSVQKACEFFKAQSEDEEEECESSETHSKKQHGKKRRSLESKGKDHASLKSSRRRKRSGSEKASRKGSEGPECKGTRKGSEGPESKGTSTKDSKVHKHERGHHCRKRKRQSSESEAIPAKQRLTSVSGSDTDTRAGAANGRIRSCDKTDMTKVEVVSEAESVTSSDVDTKAVMNTAANKVNDGLAQDKAEDKNMEVAAICDGQEKLKEVKLDHEEDKMKSINVVEVKGETSNSMVNVNEEEKDQINTEMETSKETSEMEVEKKKRRKRKKVDGKLQLRVMTKTEWKNYRNKYLNMQRKALSCIKKMLLMDKQQRSECDAMLSSSACEGSSCQPEDSTQELSFQPGVLVKVTLPEPLTTAADFRKRVASTVDIAYIDLSDGSSEMFLRFHNCDAATTALKEETLNQFGSCELVSGEEEQLYWEKLLKERQSHRNRPRQRIRGRDKILAKAAKLGERSQSHIHFDE